MPPILEFKNEDVIKFCKKDLERTFAKSAVMSFPQDISVLLDAESSGEDINNTPQSLFFLAELIHCGLFMSFQSQFIFEEGSLFDGDNFRNDQWVYYNNGWITYPNSLWGFRTEWKTNLAEDKHVYKYFRRFLGAKEHLKLDDMLKNTSEHVHYLKKLDTATTAQHHAKHPINFPHMEKDTFNLRSDFKKLIGELGKVKDLNRENNNLDERNHNLNAKIKLLEDINSKISPIAQNRADLIKDINDDIDKILQLDETHAFTHSFINTPWIFRNPFMLKRMKEHRSDKYILG